MNPLIPRLIPFSFFHGLLPQQLEALAGCAEEASFTAGHYLFQQGGAADAFYALESGLVGIEIFTSGFRRVRVQTLRGGELLGWSWLYPPYVWHFDARALKEVRALRFEARRVRDLIENDHELGFQLQKRFTPLIISRLQAARLQLAEVAGDDPADEF